MAEKLKFDNAAAKSERGKVFQSMEKKKMPWAYSNSCVRNESWQGLQNLKYNNSATKDVLMKSSHIILSLCFP